MDTEPETTGGWAIEFEKVGPEPDGILSRKKEQLEKRKSHVYSPGFESKAITNRSSFRERPQYIQCKYKF